MRIEIHYSEVNSFEAFNLKDTIVSRYPYLMIDSSEKIRVNCIKNILDKDIKEKNKNVVNFFLPEIGIPPRYLSDFVKEIIENCNNLLTNEILISLTVRIYTYSLMVLETIQFLIADNFMMPEIVSGYFYKEDKIPTCFSINQSGKILNLPINDFQLQLSIKTLMKEHKKFKEENRKVEEEIIKMYENY
jgi:hypothetical protein